MLTPDQVEAVRVIREKYGDARADALQAKLEAANAKAPPAPAVPAAPVSPTPTPARQSVIGSPGVTTLRTPGPIAPVGRLIDSNALMDAESDAITTRTRELEVLGYAPAIAREQAAQDVRGVYRPRTPASQRVPFQATKKVEELTGPSAVLEALKPRILKTPEQAREEEASAQRLKDLRFQLLREVEGEIPAGVEGDARRVARTEKLRERLAPARDSYLRVARDEYRARTGSATPPTDAEVEALGTNLYKNFVQQVAPELLPEIVKDEKKTRTTLAAEAITKVGGDALRYVLENKDEKTGQVSESMVATGLRDVNAAWRFVFEPMAAALTYDVDEQGKVIDPTDTAYWIEQNLIPTDLKTARGTAVTDGTPVTIGRTLIPRPFQARRKATAVTGDYWKDVATSIEQGKSLGQDFAELPAYQGLWDSVGIPSGPLWVGLGTELALPLTPLSYASGAGKLARGWATTRNAVVASKDAMRGVDAAVDLSKAVDDASVLNVASKHLAREVSEPVVALDRLADQVDDVIPPAELAHITTSATMRAIVAKATDAAGTSRAKVVEQLEAWSTRMRNARGAGKLSPEVAQAYDLATELSSRFAPAAPGRMQRAAARVRALVDAGDEAGAQALVDRLRLKSAANVSNDPLSSQFARALGSRVRRSGEPMPVSEAVSENLQTFLDRNASRLTNGADLPRSVEDVVADQVRESLRNRVPGDMVFVTPTVIAARSALDRIGAGVVQNTREVMAGVTKGERFIPKNAEALADRLHDAIGPARAQGSRWKEAFDDLESGKGLTPETYVAAYNEVLGDAVVRAGLGESVQYTGRAVTEASVPAVRRAETMRAVRDIYRGATAGVMHTMRDYKGYGKRIVNSFAREPVSKGRTPLVVQNWLGGLESRITNVTDEFVVELRAAQEQHGIVGGLQRVVDETVDISGQSPEQAWASLVRRYFGTDIDIEDAIITSVTEGKALTPENLLQAVADLRELDPRLVQKGLRSPIPGVNKPDIFAALTAWAVEARAAKMLRTSYDDLLGENPHLALPQASAIDDAGYDAWKASLARARNEAGKAERALAREARAAGARRAKAEAYTADAAARLAASNDAATAAQKEVARLEAEVLTASTASKTLAKVKDTIRNTYKDTVDAYNKASDAVSQHKASPALMEADRLGRLTYTGSKKDMAQAKAALANLKKTKDYIDATAQETVLAQAATDANKASVRAEARYKDAIRDAIARGADVSQEDQFLIASVMREQLEAADPLLVQEAALAASKTTEDMKKLADLRATPEYAAARRAVAPWRNAERSGVITPEMMPTPKGGPVADVATLKTQLSAARAELSKAQAAGKRATNAKPPDPVVSPDPTAARDARARATAVEQAPPMSSLTSARSMLMSLGVPEKAADDLMDWARTLDRSTERSALAARSVAQRIITGDPFGALSEVSPVELSRVTRILEDAGVTDGLIAEDARTVLNNALYGPLDDHLTSTLRGWGMLLGDSVDRSVAHLRPSLLRPTGAEVASLMGGDAVDTFNALQASARSGKLTASLEALRIKDRVGADYVWQSVVAFVKGSKRLTVGGLLGGFPLPNMRFHGVNALTAPFIIATTLDVPTALRSIRGAVKNFAGGAVPKRLTPYYERLAGVSRDTVAMRAANGQEWTRGMIEDAIARNNITSSQIGFEFSETVVADIARVARLSRDAKPVGWLRTAVRNLDPMNKNLWARLGEFTDGCWRRSVFVDALEAGATEAEAAKIARESLLDYGALNGIERDYAARFVMFYAFRRRMYKAVVETLVRDPNKIRQMIIASKQQQEEQDAWMLQQDYALTRLWAVVGPTYDGLRTASYGPSNPALDSLSDMINVLGWAGYAAETGDLQTDLVGETVLSEVMIPELRVLLDLKTNGPDEQSAGYVPGHQVAMLMEAGAWHGFVDTFDVEPVPSDRRRAGEPTFKGVQYRFRDKAAYNRYLLAETALLKLGIDRNLNDYAKLLVHEGVAPEGAEIKRLGDGSLVLVALGASTPIKLPDRYAVRERELRRILAELNTMRASR